jgi:hypothetical protein
MRQVLLVVATGMKVERAHNAFMIEASLIRTTLVSKYNAAVADLRIVAS